MYCGLGDVANPLLSTPMPPPAVGELGAVCSWYQQINANNPLQCDFSPKIAAYNAFVFPGEMVAVLLASSAMGGGPAINPWGNFPLVISAVIYGGLALWLFGGKS
jgi:hypothetical protein